MSWCHHRWEPGDLTPRPYDAPAPDSGAPMRVLVGDDRELVRTGYGTVFGAQPDLEAAGEAGDGRAAVEAARRPRPDVVMTDIRMPLLHGIEATRLPAGPGVAEPMKVRVVTTFDLDEYVYEALRAGASGFLLADSPPRDLVDGIRTVAADESLPSPAVARRHPQARRQVRLPHPPPPRDPRHRGVVRPGTPRDRGAETRRRGPVERRDRRPDGHQPRDRQDVRVAHPGRTRPARPGPGGRARPPRGPGRPHG
ncbi:DNA-binding NarL/FixJ family response regulator [Streptomyces sp. TE5632]